MPKRPKLGKTQIDKLEPPEEGFFDVFCGELRGFHIRVSASGRKTYRLKYSAAGRARVATIGEHGAPWLDGSLTVDRARKEGEQLRGLINAGVDPVAAKRKVALDLARAITLQQLIEKYLAEGASAKPSKRQSSWDHDASRLRRHIIPLLGKLPASEVRRVDVEDAQRKISQGGTAADIKTKKRGRAIIRGGKAVAGGALASLSACYAWAIERELVEVNPVEHVEKHKPQPRERFLSQREVGALLDVMNAMEREKSLSKVFADELRMLLLTGARKQEVAGLRWAEIDFDRKLVRLPRHRSKTGEKLILLVPAAMQILEARRPKAAAMQKRPFVFSSPLDETKAATGIQKAWQRVRVRAKLADVRIHDLRHTFASFAAASGASLPLIAKALGHRQTSTTERYAHLGTDPVREIVDRVGETVMSSATPKRQRGAEVISISDNRKRRKRV